MRYPARSASMSIVATSRILGSCVWRYCVTWMVSSNCLRKVSSCIGCVLPWLHQVCDRPLLGSWFSLRGAEDAEIVRLRTLCGPVLRAAWSCRHASCLPAATQDTAEHPGGDHQGIEYQSHRINPHAKGH